MTRFYYCHESVKMVRAVFVFVYIKNKQKIFLFGIFFFGRLMPLYFFFQTIFLQFDRGYLKGRKINAGRNLMISAQSVSENIG